MANEGRGQPTSYDEESQQVILCVPSNFQPEILYKSSTRFTFLHVMLGAGSPWDWQGIVSCLPTSCRYSARGETRNDGGSWEKQWVINNNNKKLCQHKKMKGVIYLEDNFGRFWLAHGPVAVICRTGVHAHRVIIGCSYKHRTLRVHHPAWKLTNQDEENSWCHRQQWNKTLDDINIHNVPAQGLKRIHLWSS